jgi:hypothetical protein
MSKGPDPRGFQFTLTDLLLLTAAAGLWMTLLLLTRQNPYVPSPVIALVLIGITLALHSILQARKHAWTVAAVLAPIIVGLCLAGTLLMDFNWGDGALSFRASFFFLGVCSALLVIVAVTWLLFRKR